MYDLDGLNAKYNLLRKIMRPLVDHYIAVSRDLASWLVDTVGARPARVTQIYNGVDLQRFHPRTRPRPPLGPIDFSPAGTLVVGTVGRMEPVKDQLTLVRAFLHLVKTEPDARERLRLVMIGDGTLREVALQLLRTANVEDLAWLPGERPDVPEIMRGLDLFVLPSLREGISNTILEAMATGLPIVATQVGGNPELVQEGETGILVPPAGQIAMAEAIRGYLANPSMLRRHGEAGRKRVEENFSMQAMVNGYLAVYDAVLNRKAQLAAGSRQQAASSRSLA
jgi:sugar transferase (PEP-CTERM/EpsH1 system associated)